MSTISDAALILIDSKLGPIYEGVVKKRESEEVTNFEISEMISCIRSEKETLEKQRGTLAQELNERSSTASQSRSNFGSKLTIIDSKLSSCLESSKNLAASSSQLSVDFAQITDRLDSATTIVGRAKSIAQYIKDIQVYNENENLDDVLADLKKNEIFPLDDISKTSEYVAKLIKIVSITAKQGFVEVAAKNLHRHSDRLVAELSQRISDSSDPIELKDYFSSLMILAPGDEPVNNFISSTGYFTSVDGINLQYSEEILRDSVPQKQNHFDALCTFILDQSKVLWPKIDVIFDRPAQVKHTLLMKVCNRLLSVFVDAVLQDISQRQPKSYCQMLHFLYERSQQMFDGIWKLDFQNFASSSTYLDVIFLNHQRNYGSFEISILKEYLSSKVEPPIEKLDRVQKQSSFTVIFKKSEDIINPFDVFNDEVPHEVISSAKEALVRCALLSPPEQISSNFTELISIFIDLSFSKYLTTIIRTCSFYLLQSDNSQNIAKFIKLITMINSSVLSLEEAYKNHLKPLLQPLSIVHSNFIKSKESLITNLENETVKGLQNCIEMACASAKKILASKQKKQDFSSNVSTRPTITEACQQCCAFIKTLTDDVSSHMFGDNKTSFLTHFGKHMLIVIVDHLAQFRYSTHGAGVLILDASEYQAVFNSFEVEKITARVMDLVKVVHLMGITTELLLDDIRGQTYSSNAVSIAKRLLVLRMDAKDIQIDELFPGGNALS